MTNEQPTDPRLEPFKELNKKKVPWEERMKVVHRQFPSTASLDWKRAFDADVNLLGRIIGDVLKADMAEPGRPGKRAAVDRRAAEARLRQMLGAEYSIEPFSLAFKTLVNGRSIRSVAAKTGLDRNAVYRLLEGKMSPDAYEMETIAKAYHKQPEYFVEYRIAYVTAVVAHRLAENPEAAFGIFRKVKGLVKGA